MPEREMEQLKVYDGKNGHICISQSHFGSNEDDVIIIHPAQVDLLIQWLKEIKIELEKE